jgi:hypothetical protein
VLLGDHVHQARQLHNRNGSRLHASVAVSLVMINMTITPAHHMVCSASCGAGHVPDADFKNVLRLHCNRSISVACLL